MSTIKTNAITNIASTHTFTLDDVGYPLSTAWDGILLDETTTPKLSEVGIIGLNPIAYVYPDGTIAGESDNGNFTKWADGNLECVVKVTIDGTGWILGDGGHYYTPPIISTYPVEFIVTPAVIASANDGQVDTRGSWVTYANAAKTAVTLYMASLSSNAADSRLSYISKGKWK